jgi:hypothetical protein
MNAGKGEQARALVMTNLSASGPEAEKFKAELDMLRPDVRTGRN